ncbi:hypothetical protein [Sphingomonas cavernae]|uniref:Uncharacterized protein n=1 Tax=Sphingomonas cavernae TaxID=2320861 RepID=A0A418WQG5_9SPHN|nr:hypothetical protein [Sphingomonas cavernae]RJF93399.1 hypothetical protein D3876_03395 [Sphingomonas cavernae]
MNARLPARHKRGLFVRSVSGNWYCTVTAGPSDRLRATIALGFETPRLDKLDEQGAIIARGTWRR